VEGRQLGRGGGATPQRAGRRRSCQFGGGRSLKEGRRQLLWPRRLVLNTDPLLLSSLPGEQADQLLELTGNQ
jgi:hypothetical protein